MRLSPDVRPAPGECPESRWQDWGLAVSGTQTGAVPGDRSV